MPSIHKTSNGKWRAQVRIKGQSASKYFETKTLAREWAYKQEDFLRDPEYSINKLTFADVLDRYVKEVSVTKPTYKRESIRATFLKTFPIAKMRLSDIKPKHLNEYRVTRMRTVQASTVARDFSFIGAVFEAARKNWQLIKVNPLRDTVKPPSTKPRNARITQEEIDLIVADFGYDDDSKVTTTHQQVAVVFLIAIETAMRQSEITGIEWDNVAPRSILLPKTKNGDSRLVPLSLRAVELINKMPRDRKKPFTVSSDTVSIEFREARRRLGIDHIHFHDSRREATSRLAKKFDVMMLAKITGHKDLKMLLNVYYAPELDEFTSIMDG